MYEIRGVPIVKRIWDAIRRDVDNRVRLQGVTLSQIQLLLRLDATDGGKLTFKALEQRLSVSQAAVAGIVRRLKDKGFIEVHDDETDGRIKHAKITESGHRVCGDAREHMDAIECTLVSALSADEAQTFLKLLLKVSQSLK